jgi:spore coat protein U-like protein
MSFEIFSELTMKRNIFASFAIAGLGVAAVAMQSFAGTPLTGGTVTSTTSVVEECQWYAPGGTVSAGSTVALAFGAYSPFAATDLDAATPAGAGALAVYCANGTAGITIALDGGANGTATVRKMKDGTNASLINYELYKETGRTNVWGGGGTFTGGTTLAATDATSATTAIVSASGATTIFGRIPKNQNAAVGTGYTDTVNITVAY